MIYLVVGSRSFNNYELLTDCLNKKQDISHIISGGASGADTLAYQYSKEYKIPMTIYWADWDKYGKSAGMIRNNKMLEVIKHKNGKIIAFFDGSSKGTSHTIAQAEKQNIPIEVVIC